MSENKNNKELRLGTIIGLGILVIGGIWYSNASDKQISDEPEDSEKRTAFMFALSGALLAGISHFELDKKIDKNK